MGGKLRRGEGEKGEMGRTGERVVFEAIVKFHYHLVLV
jgi:hypothetical protein